MTDQIPQLTILDGQCVGDIADAGHFEILQTWLTGQGLHPPDVYRIEISNDNGKLTGRVTEGLRVDGKPYCARLHRHEHGCELATRTRDVVLSSPPPAELYDLAYRSPTEETA